jgi:hypothetical protein
VGGDEEDSGGYCWRPVCSDEGSFVVSVLMRETVACLGWRLWLGEGKERKKGKRVSWLRGWK